MRRQEQSERATASSFTITPAPVGAWRPDVSSVSPFRSPQGGAGARVLFVNAPFGPFFRDLCKAGDKIGVKFERCAFDAGDFVEAPHGRARVFRGKQEQFAHWFRGSLQDAPTDLVVVFNDTLPLNRIAAQEARNLSVPVVSLEQGYLRPHWVTLESGPTNGAASREPASTVPTSQRQDPILSIEPQTLQEIVWTNLHFAVAMAVRVGFRYNARYYGASVLRQMIGYMGEFFRPMGRSERRWRRLAAKRREPFYCLCILQKPGDTQLVVHSSIRSNNELLERVIASFKAFAPAEMTLVVKRHPYDFGIENTRRHLRRLVGAYGLEGRVFFIERMNLGEVLPKAAAVVLNNSSVGLEALQLGKPVFALGRARYVGKGLASSQDLHAFWRNPPQPDAKAVSSLVAELQCSTQINGGFFSREARRVLTPRLAQRLKDVVTSTETYADNANAKLGNRF